ncbi:DUF1127 domain-containing protein [Roseovarius aestuarii]|uniref:YjiS-like domain-containing protein n=1 Tax=Roseovarius aestuarii TaxID=475083 RepID=A0A1X7BST7_9RHOB|nr:DUF1127 domain-containing protein [Roseovarius aestuarii]SMC12736.1 hypothetical protein ROA7745_02566 [Roseovarius aestuarii]
MAFATDTRTATGGLKIELSAAIYRLMARVTDYRSYRRTVSALSDLGSRELADLGLSRASIHSTAYSAVYGTRA